MTRVLAFALVVLWVGLADAAPKRKIRIVTEPAGATVYIGATEDGPACEPTPCSIEVEPGETSIVIDLKDHQRDYLNVVVPKKGKVADAKFTLRLAIGTINVPGPAGASVTIDEIDQGKAPLTYEVPAEGHHVVIIFKGKTVYDGYVDVAAGAEVVVEAKKVAGGGGEGGDEGGEGGEGGGGEGGEGGGEGSGGEIEGKVTPSTPRDRYLSLSALVDIGFRDFNYANAAGENVPTGKFGEDGQVLVGPGIELWPGTMAGVRFLRGLSIFGRYQYGLNKQPVDANLMGATNTFWQSMELSLRHRWTFAKRVTIEIGGGYVRDQYQFEAMNPLDRPKLPDVDYKGFRFGGRVSLLLPFASGHLEPFVTFENRSISSGGLLEDKFTKADPSGYRASAGIAARLGKIIARAELSAIQFSWDLESNMMSPTQASSATDAIRVIGLSAGYEY